MRQVSFSEPLLELRALLVHLLELLQVVEPAPRLVPFPFWICCSTELRSQLILINRCWISARRWSAFWTELLQVVEPAPRLVPLDMCLCCSSSARSSPSLPARTFTS